MRALVANTAVIGLGTILSKALAFLLVPVATFILSPEDFGKYDLAVTFIGLLVPTVTLQLEQAIFRFVFEDQARADRYFTPAFAFVASIALSSGGILYVVCSVGLGLDFALPLAVYFVALACYTCSIECVRGLGRLGVYSVFNVLSGVLVFLGVLAFVWWLNLGIVGLLWSFAAPYALLTVCLLATVTPLRIRSLRCLRAPRVLGTMLAYSAPLVPNVISFWVANVSDRALITYFLGVGANGLYAVGARVSTLLAIFFGVFNISFQQTAVDSQSDSDREVFFGRIFVRSGNFLFGLASVVTGFSPLLFRTVFGAAFSEAYRYVPGLVLGTLFLSLAQYLGNLLIAFRRTKVVGVSTVAGAALNVAMNLALIPIIGAYGAVFSTIAAYLLMLVVRYRIVAFRLVRRGDLPTVVLAFAGYILTSLLVLVGTGPGWDLAAAGMGVLVFSLLSGAETVKLLRLGRR